MDDLIISNDTDDTVISSFPKPNWHFGMNTKKDIMLTDVNAWDYNLGIDKLIEWTACE